MDFFARFFGTRNDRFLKTLQPYVARINELEPRISALSEDQLRGQTALFRERLEKGEPLDSILPEAFATCREAGKRVLGQRHYDVQLMGGIVLHQGKISEMKTGEGKTLTATLGMYLRGLVGKGAHLVTVNDYLAKRDAEWMGKLYNYLNLNVGIIVHGLSDTQRKASYAADITYGTNNEFGFDYLRDNMKTEPERLVQRDHYFAIVDEVDSILIDEARTPLIISGPAETNTNLYKVVNTTIPGLLKDSDYIVDEKSRVITLTEDGVNKLEKRLKISNLYDPQSIDYLHHVQQALKAHFIFKKDVDYVVRSNEVLIVDEFTGRLMPGRRYSDGLHGALEAKENVEIQNETQTMATITFQNYFRLYDVLAGMTGTADTEAVEFQKIYKLEVTSIPTNRKFTRIDEQDVIYRTAREKYNAIATEIAEYQAKGQPILVGTVSVEKSELLAHLLKKKNVPHEILNAKNHAREAGIIAEAGQKGRVTIATNMAGRGTDIILGQGVQDLGGLYVIGTERHESRRIDNQLRGRSGRQGDPGRSKFFLSLEDDLMRIFASDRLSAIMGRLGMEEGEAIISPMVTRAIEKAQKRVEEQNFSSRKNLLEYDDVMNQQRQVIYKRRNEALHKSKAIDFKEHTLEVIISAIATRYSPEYLNQENWDVEKFVIELSNEMHQKLDLPEDRFEKHGVSVEVLAHYFTDQVLDRYKDKLKDIPEEKHSELECYIYLSVIDQAWKEHLLAMDTLKDSVSLRGYGQRDPLQEYKKEAFELFSRLMTRIEEETTLILVRMGPPKIGPMPQPHEQLDELQEVEDDEDSTEHDEHKQRLAAVKQKQSAPVAAPRPSLVKATAAPGRNDPCPCGSGKKYKKCHGSE